MLLNQMAGNTFTKDEAEALPTELTADTEMYKLHYVLPSY